MKWACSGLCCLLLVCLLGSRQQTAPPNPDRWLSAFTNDDGSRPDGNVSTRDDSSAMNTALTAGPGIVHIGPGHYRLSDVSIPDGVTVVGTGTATILHAAGSKPVFHQKGLSGWRLRDVTVQGEATGPWQQRTDLGAHGIVIEGCFNYEVSGVQIKDFAGVGLQIARTNIQTSGFTNGGIISAIATTGNHTGVRFDTRGEYVTASQLMCHYNVIGVTIHAGNTNIANSNIGSNTDGILIVDHENGSHGSLTGCLVNHNERYAILARNVDNAMAISNCCFFYGTIHLEDCEGINVTSSLLGCNVTTAGKLPNRFAGNHVSGEGQKFEFAPATILEGNFSKTGPWEPTKK